MKKRRDQVFALVRSLTVVALTAALLLGSALAYSRATTDWNVTDFDVSVSGDALVLELNGTSWGLQDDILSFAYPDGSTVTYKAMCTSGEQGLRTTGWEVVSGTSGSFTQKVWPDSGFQGSIVIPLSLLKSTGFTMTFDGVEVTSAELGLGSSTPQPETTEQPQETPVPTLTGDTVGKITVDADLSDWENVAPMTYTEATQDHRIDWWKAARDEAGNLYLCFSGETDNEWVQFYQWKGLTITQNGESVWAQLNDAGRTFGAVTAAVNTANHNTGGPCYFEMRIPADYLTDPNFTLTLGADSIPAGSLPVMDGTEPAPQEPPVYRGIVIDGEYDDWAAVTRYDAKDPGEKVETMSMVFDGDYVYVYLKEVEHTNGAYNSGSHGNSKFSITTDLGNELLFSLNEDGTLNGLDHGTAAHVGAQWEIAIPKSDLPEYSNSLSLGYYLCEPTITGVSNLDGSGGNTSFSGSIQIDGVYGDWSGYPHHNIEYATAGTDVEVRDANGALYAEGDILYGHVYTTYQRHLDELNGHEFTSGVTIRFNENDSVIFHPMNLTADENGNLNWSPALRDLPDGTYRFILVDRDGWSGTDAFPTVDSLDNHLNQWIPEGTQRWYGVMYVTIKEGRDECEFYLDLTKIAKKLDMDDTDMKVIEAQFINIGNEWIRTAGASSGALLGVGLSCAVAGAVILARKRKEEDGKR